MFIPKWLKNIIFVYLALTYLGCQGCMPSSTPPEEGYPYEMMEEGEEEGYPSFEDVDKALKSFVEGGIAFNTPKEIQWNNTAVIELFLSPSLSIDELKDKITEAGEREGAKIRVAPTMSAVLESSGFEIKEFQDKIQGISSVEATKWEWEITPIKRGEQTLCLTISALLSVNGERTPRKIVPTYKKKIYIKVTFIQQLGFFIKDKWDWLWGVILIPLIIWTWKKWKSKKMNKAT
jgi:hypothetical protein